MFNVLYSIFSECRKYILRGLPKQGISKNKKGDVTKYFDKFIENKIISKLKIKCKLKAKLISEEQKNEIEINKNFSGDYNYIIIDPVDGSDNYSASIPFVCFGVAIFNNKKEPIYSFAGNYYSGDFIYADKNKILFNNKQKNLHHKQSFKKILIFTFSKSKIKNHIKFQRLINDFDLIRSLGATIGEMILVSKSIADAFVDVRGKLTFENFAPFFLIARHLDLKLTDEKGKDLSVNNFSLTKKYKIIFANSKVSKEIVNKL